MSADLGISPYDALGMVLEREMRGKFKYKEIRIVTDLCCVVTGLLLAHQLDWERF